MRIPNAFVGDVTVESLTVSNIFAGYLEGGPDGATLLAALRGYRDDPRATTIRWDAGIAPETRSSDVVRRVPHWLHRAALRYRDPDDDVADSVEAVVAWLGPGIGKASLEETLLAGIGDADLALDVAPISYGLAAGGSLVAQSGAFAITGRSWRFDLGPASVALGAEPQLVFFDDETSFMTSSVDVPLGSVLVTAQLRGPPINDHTGERRSGQWQTSLALRAVLAVGREALGDVLRARISRLDWARFAHEWFDDWDDY